MTNERDVILRIKGVKTYFSAKKRFLMKHVPVVKAVDNVELNVFRGETLGIVGESGCGKTTLGKSVLQLIPISEGVIEYHFEEGFKDLRKLSKKDLKKAREKIQIVFQDPYSSLNPALTIGDQLQDPLIEFGVKSKSERISRLEKLLEDVNLPKEVLERYPNEFSGGQRQRIGVARALSVNPELIICDEAVSALDVSIQAQVLKLLKDLKAEHNLTYLFISHDLSVVEYIADRVAVMYLGRIVELAETDELYKSPLHPYTKALLSAIPVADLSQVKKRIPLQGDVPSPANPPSGCPFHPRCPQCFERCKTEKPEYRHHLINEKDHYVACHLIAD